MGSEIPGLSVESLHDDAIVAYTLQSAQMATISAWSDLAVNKIKGWPKNRPYLALHDLSNPGVGLLYLTAVEFDPFNVGVTPGGRNALRDLLAANPDWPVVLALVVSTSLSGRLTRLRITDVIEDLPKITSRTFFKRSAAIEWLLRQSKPEDTAVTMPQMSLGSRSALIQTIPAHVPASGVVPMAPTQTPSVTLADVPASQETALNNAPDVK